MIGDAEAVDLGALHVVVPVRSIGAGKSRLGQALDAEERLALIIGLLVRTLTVLASWPASGAVHVVTPDLAVRRLVRASGLGIRVIPERDSGGLNAALIEGRARAVRSSASAVLYLPADLPHLSVAALDGLRDAADAALAAGSGGPLVVAAPADARSGTNALLVAPPATIEPHFGEASLAAHARAAAVAGASLLLVDDPALGFDLDTPEDLERLEATQLLTLQALGQGALDAASPATRTVEVA